MAAARRAFERNVRALSSEAERLSAMGLSAEQVARHVVERRNELKRLHRVGVAQELLATLETRNRTKYGHPVGPTADELLHRYGSWEAVIAAAARPATPSSTN